MREAARRAGAAALTVALAAVVVWGIAVGEPTGSSRVEALGAQIKCPVCNGETIVDSPAGFATDMLAVVEEQVDEGWSDDQILSYFETRFPGSRLDAGFSGSGALLWILPVAVAAGGVAAFVGLVRGRGDGDGSPRARPRDAAGAGEPS
jgi:cytochrome c-type biogenesis protein CcmH